MSKTIDIRQLGATIRAHDEHMIESIKTAQLRAALRGVPIVATATPVDRGATRAGWRAVPTLYGAELRNDSAIAGILELGSRPHRPPLMPILRWLVRQIGIDGKGGRRSFADIGEVESEVVGRAMGIVRSIERRGTRAHYMVRDNLPRLVRILQAEAEKAAQSRQPVGGD